METDTDSTGSQVIARAAKLFKAVEEQPQGLTISALSRSTGLPRTTVHRLVASLEAEQLLLNSSGMIRLGPALARLAASAHTDVISLSRPSIETLGRRTRETVDLCVYRGSHALLVSQYASDQELRVVSPVGTAFPCHCTATGKALLAGLQDEQISLIYTQKPETRTALSLRTVAGILDEVEKIRSEGFASDREEHAKGVCGLGVSIPYSLNENYAISVAVPASRFDENFDFLVASLKQCKAEIEALISPTV
ncbi:IclR family transcriptional regulator [Sodalis sp. RH22]|uniref:IclR family transcriptional regulator n=1 Tax=unclassified Sodalis (in: enterobacteria) TaxID=2636512 RepID=UPI0039B3B3F4